MTSLRTTPAAPSRTATGATPNAMPMAELGLVLGISDAKKFSAAMKEYRLTLNELRRQELMELCSEQFLVRARLA